jgi:hypothetical protein
VNLIDRELKFFFTSPILIVLELAPAALVTYITLYSGAVFLKPLVPLLPVAWVIIVLYSTFFELEVWRREFLNRGVKLKIYTNTSEYTPFLAHSLVSLILLELKTLIVLIPSVRLLTSPEVFASLTHFLLVTHGNWLFSLSFGCIFSGEIFRKPAVSIPVFLCVLVFSLTTFVFSAVTIPAINQPPDQSPPSYFLNAFRTEQSFTLIVAVLILSVILYFSALYASSLMVRNIRIDDI